MAKKIFIGVAWPYVNGALHVGHLAGYMLPADIFARYCRFKGYETIMVSGADCHGSPITIEAEKKGITPEELVAIYYPKILTLIKKYNISFDIFTSTTTTVHKKNVKQFFMNLLKNGYILKRESYQFFSLSKKKFLPDRYIEGQCKYCYALQQRADQCDVCGRLLEPQDLINPYDKLTKEAIELRSTEHYAFDLAQFELELRKFIEEASHWRKWVRAESLGFLKEGIKARDITRDILWGIKLPVKDIPKHLLLKNISQKRFYVWFEAVIGYVSATIEWSRKIKNDKNYWQEIWFNESWRHYYFMGKDNLIFHTLLWPAELLGQRKNYNLPFFPAVNNFLLFNEQKFSKSRGIMIDALALAKKFDPDLIRFYITSIMPEKKDTNFQWNNLEKIINTELVNKISNFIHRVAIFYIKNFNNSFIGDNIENDVVKNIKKYYASISFNLENCEFLNYYKNLIDYIDFANNYFTQKAPWHLIYSDKDKALKVATNALQLIYSLRLPLALIMPLTEEKITKMFGFDKISVQLNKDNFQFAKIPYCKFKNKNIKPLFEKINLE